MTPRRPLFRKYLRVLLLVVCPTLLAASTAQAILSARAQSTSVDALLSTESRLASVQIQSFLTDIVGSLSWILDYDQPGLHVDLRQIRDESQQLLRKLPSISTLRYIDKVGCLRLTVARVGTDSDDVCGAVDLAPGDASLLKTARTRGLAYGPVRFHNDSIPYVNVALAARGRHGGMLLAEVDLRQIHATITDIRVGDTGYAYIVDHQWQLVAHPDNSLVLRHLDLAGLPLVASAAAAGNTSVSAIGRDLAGAYVLSSSTVVPGPAWRVFVELPAAEAFHPILVQLWLSLAIIGIAMLAAAVASHRLARRMTQPILAVQAGAGRMAAGELDTRITVNTGDEVELLAREFNHMAAALSESYAALEDKVRRRTHALESASDQLRIQSEQLAALNAELSLRLGELGLRRDEAERASAAKTRFLAAASHDLLQPLHAVGLLVGILLQRIRFPEVRDLVMKVEATVRGMETLFGSLLDISKLDSQSVKADVQSVELHSLLKYVDLNFQPPALEKGLRLRIAPCRFIVRSDPDLLERIVANLVSNAIRYTDSGTVLVGCRRMGSMVRLLVYDTGIGIPQHDQVKIFEEFYQVERGERPRGNGLGLGLSIVRRSADLLGLGLHMRSAPGAGSVFGIDLPLHLHGSVSLGQSVSPDAGHEQLHGAFIAVLDNDEHACCAMEQLLRSAGCHVVAGLSWEAVRLLLAGHLRTPDLIVTNLRLGSGTSGIDAIVAIRSDNLDQIPAIILTGDSNPLAPSDFPPHCQLIRKPVGPQRLLALCAALLTTPQATRSAAPAFLQR